MALAVARNLQSPGLFAVEMLVDKEGNVFVNETAPRVHNSGHHTIEAHYCSQFDMLITDHPRLSFGKYRCHPALRYAECAG